MPDYDAYSDYVKDAANMMYCICCFQWFSLLYPDNVVYLNSFRECYEACVIYSFMRFLFNYLHESFDDIEETLRQKLQVSHIFPFCFLRNWKMGRQVFERCMIA